MIRVLYLQIDEKIINILRKIHDWGNSTITIPGWIIFGLFVFILPIIIIIIAWTFPICQNNEQLLCLQNISNIRIYMSIISLGFPTMIGLLYLRFKSLQKPKEHSY